MANKMAGCLPNEFRCSNSCVDLVRRCDLQPDCPDGSDELGCESFVCPATHFKCANHFCVPLDAVCNFVDNCGDGSDELKCLHRKCWKPEFRCDNGECIRPGFVCDGLDDCKDGSDETDCAPDRFVRCGDGSLLHRYYWCDGWPDCADNHADELFCGNCSGPDDFLCPNGRCIRRANVCDSQCDCAGRAPGAGACADELDCHTYRDVQGVRLCDPINTLTCALPEQSRDKERCIHRHFICDSVNDCQSGEYLSDEFGCDVADLVGPVFACSDNRTLPQSLRCDHKPDCLRGDDELDCEWEPCPPDHFRCDNGQCVEPRRVCDLRFDCWDKSDELHCGAVACGEGRRKCTRGGQCVPLELWCDFFLDCPDGSDEANCGELQTRACAPAEFRCESGQCVDSGLRCFNPGDPRQGCADGSHLVGCKEWACPEGSFKCRNGPCVNSSLVCNENIDCPNTWVDEDGCAFLCSNHEPRCLCRDTQINCTGLGLRQVPPDIEEEITWFHMGSNLLNSSLHEDSFINLDRLLYLDLSNNSIACLPPLVFRNLWRLHVLNLQRNRIHALLNGSFTGLPNLRGLHLQGNEIEILEPMAFYGLSSLTTLDLSHQRIRNVSQGTFVGLRCLVGLDLSHNEIAYLTDGSLNGLPQLLSLDLSSNSIKVISSNVFRSASSLEKLVTDEFRFCCLARHVAVCLPPPDEFSSCEDLMSNLVLRVCIWVLGVVATAGNILVIGWRLRFKHANQVHSFLIMNLAVGDLFMGSYLLIIAVVDTCYRGVYFIHDSSWRSSELCQLAGFISTFSSELSVFTLTVITLDRFLVIIFPFRVQRLEMAKTRLLMAGGWLVAALLSGLPLLGIEYFRNFYGRSGVCLALHITPEKPSGWEYSVFVFLFLNMASFATIAAGYLWMYAVARTTQQAVKKDQRSSDAAMARRMTLIVATDAACWMPIILLGVLSLSGVTVPPQVFAWIAVFVLPLNAAVNPVLYTISTAPFLGPARRSLLTFQRSCKMSLPADQRRSTLANNCSRCEPGPGACATNGAGLKQPASLPADQADLEDSRLLARAARQHGSKWRSASCRQSRPAIDTAVSEKGETIPLRQLSMAGDRESSRRSAGAFDENPANSAQSSADTPHTETRLSKAKPKPLEVGATMSFLKKIEFIWTYDEPFR
ncbi:G-protein coupled receptor GRL101-like [Bacillus rossius redtenbacheri]|uniref:G-protein coupled receptor GRL101-like n=1 Tax=Bacillus rossius redtenbacheri TaxID=93214 RepID=UPI002FDCC8DB